MKKIFLQIIFVLFLCVNAHSEDQPVYVELICAPDTEWEGMASENKKIWFPSLKPKFFIHMDLKKMKVVKIGYSKDEDEIRDVSIPIEKNAVDGNIEYQFIKSGSLNENLNVFNIINVLSNDFMDGIFVIQYQLNGKVTNFILDEMKDDTPSELERSLKLYTKNSGEFIGYTGGMSSPECKRVRKYK